MQINLLGYEMVAYVWEPDGLFRPSVWQWGTERLMTPSDRQRVYKAWAGPFHFMVCHAIVSNNKQRGNSHGDAATQGGTPSLPGG